MSDLSNHTIDAITALAVGLEQTADQGVAAKLVQGFSDMVQQSGVSLATVVCAVAHLQASLLVQTAIDDRPMMDGAVAMMTHAKLGRLLEVLERRATTH